MKYKENSDFSSTNRSLLIEDFYYFYYCLESEKKDIKKLEPKSDFSLEEIINYQEHINDGLSIFQEDVLQSISLLLDYNELEIELEKQLDIIDYTTTLYGLFLSMEFKEPVKEDYEFWLEGFKIILTEAREKALLAQ